MFRFILKSYIVRWVLVATAGYCIVLGILSKVFDINWEHECQIPIENLNDVYKAPLQYDNFSKLNLKFENPGKLGIEANKRFIVSGSGKQFDYYDTIDILKPDTGFSYINRIFIDFENSNTNDSINFTVSKSHSPDIYWNQIFYSTVNIENLNEFSDDAAEFRLNPSLLVRKELLENNDSLINEAIYYFNINKDNLGLAECGTNSNIFKSVCNKFSVPCRTVRLQGGDATQAGYDENIGYPRHEVCEVYSSKLKKWYVIDPSYGSVFTNKNIPLNAAEICDKVFFPREEDIQVDSVLTTKKYPINKDYFKYYENLFFASNFKPNFIENKFLKWFYSKYDYEYLLFSNRMLSTKNCREYLILKSSLYIILTLIYTNIIFIIVALRSLKSKRTNSE